MSLTLSLSSFAATDGNVGDANAGGNGSHNTISITGGYHVGDAGYRIYIVDANSPTVL